MTIGTRNLSFGYNYDLVEEIQRFGFFKVWEC